MNLHELKPAQGAKKSRRRIARGEGSGYGDTATRGHKGAKSRSGYSQKEGFEGGQMPLHRRLPKFGFKNPFRIEYNIINLDKLQELSIKFPGEELSSSFLIEHGLLKRSTLPLKILSNGSIDRSVTIKASKASKAAIKSIEEVGGKVILPEFANSNETTNQ